MKKSIFVVGSGYWGKNLVRNFHAIGALKGICDKNEATLKSFEEQYGVETCIALQDVLNREDVTAVAVSTPAETHYNIAREVLLAGKHLYMEKPLALDIEEGRELVRLAKKNNLVLMIGHLLQYHPAFLKLQSMVNAGELGRINYIYSNRLNLGKIRREENILWSFAPHDISMILSLAGEEPTEVCCQGGYYLHKRIADVTNTHLAFPSGVQAHIFVSWLHPFKEQKLVVVGERQMAVFDDTRPWGEKLCVYPHRITWEDNVPTPDKGDSQFIELTESEPLRDECMHFIECVQNGTQPRTDGEEGIRVLKVLNASQQSMDNNGISISIEAASQCRRATWQAHPTAEIDEGCSIGDNTKIWHFSHVMKGSTIGKSCNIGQNVVIGPNAVIGNGCKLQNNVSVFEGVTLEDEIFCGPSMVFTNVFNPRAAISRKHEFKPTLVKKGATLGANCTIVCGNTIGRYALVGAGSVVTRDIPDHALVMGVPATVTGWVCSCGEKLQDDLACPACQLKYQKHTNGLEPISA